MYTRLNSRRPISMVMDTELEWELAADKSCAVIRLVAEADNTLAGGTITAHRHCLHVYRNPAYGQSLQIITPDDGPVELALPSKTKQRIYEDLDWDYKVFLVRVDMPAY